MNVFCYFLPKHFLHSQSTDISWEFNKVLFWFIASVEHWRKEPAKDFNPNQTESKTKLRQLVYTIVSAFDPVVSKPQKYEKKKPQHSEQLKTEL